MTQSVHLLVDVGNSRIKWNPLPVDAKEFNQPTQAFAWNLDTLSDQLETNWGSITGFVTYMTIANVAGDEIQKTLAAWCTSHWKIDPQFVTTTSQFGEIKNGYAQHRELGVDRWLAVIAAHLLYPESTNIVIDCGSALTVDTVLPDGKHLPGPIIPGQDSLFKTLMSKTAFAKSETQQASEEQQVFVTNTKDALLSGAKFATSGALDAIVRQTSQALSSADLKIIVSGGAAQRVLSMTTIKEYLIEPDLVLKGLRLFIKDQQ
jgi:type III pantothenate kinase